MRMLLKNKIAGLIFMISALAAVAQDLNAIKAELNNHLDNGLILFWTSEKIRDVKYGGWLNITDQEGNPKGQTVKTLISHLRLLYVHANAIAREKDPAKKILLRKVYDLNMDFLESKFKDGTNAGWFDQLNVEGTKAGRNHVLVSNVYALYILSELKIILGDEKAKNLADYSYSCLEKMWDEKYGGYYCESGKNESMAKDSSVNFHAMLALTSYHNATGHKEALDKLRVLYNAISLYLLDPVSKHGYTQTRRDWSYPGAPSKATAVYGHDIELMWYSVRAGRKLGKTDAEILKWVTPAADVVLRDVITEKGFVWCSGSFDGRPDGQLIHFWCQAEAMTLMMDMYQMTGDRKYLDAFVRVKEWTFKYCAKPNGYWIPVIRTDGSAVQESFPGIEWCGGLHPVRMVLEVTGTIDLINGNTVGR